MESGANRRSSRRCPCRLPIWLIDEEGALRGEISDLSESGAFVASVRDVRGAKVELYLRTQGRPLRVHAEVVHTQSRGIGVHFAPSRDLPYLRDLLPA